MAYEILSETEIEIYTTPEKRVKQRVITYKAEALAPRTVWIDSDNLPDVVYQAKNPGKPVPPDVQTKGDAVRKAAFDADIARVKAAPQTRTI